MSFRDKTLEVSESNRFQNFILLIISLNAVTIGLQTFDLGDKNNQMLDMLDNLFLWIFVVELFIRIHAHRIRFFGQGDNLFDFVIVVASLAPQAGPWSVLRVFRVFRALRLITSMPEMQRMVEAMLRSLRAIGAIGWLLCLVLYVFSVMATILYGDGGPNGELYFGNLGLSLYSLFQIMTLESWSHGIARLIIEEQGWEAAIFFIGYILCTSFTFLNMFIAVFTNTLAAIDIEEGDEQGFSRMHNEIKAEISELKVMISELNQKFDPTSEE
ncbi:MAG: ion transporter [Candidatus Thermoplasmatota archaeon]|nr:ion transporter [Candidatus Thermoplasmatota archaeon]